MKILYLSLSLFSLSVYIYSLSPVSDKPKELSNPRIVGEAYFPDTSSCYPLSHCEGK